MTRFVVLLGGVLIGCGRIDFASRANDASQATVCPRVVFEPQTPVSAGVGTRAIATADLDEDGRPDVIATEGSDAAVGVLIGNRDGTLRAAVNYPVGTNPWSLATGDLDGDGHVDVAVGNFADDTVSILLGRGDGTLGAATTVPVDQAPQGTALADLDADGHLDLVTTAYTMNTLSVWYGVGDGTFTSHGTFVPGTNPYGLTTGDWTGDGLADVIVASVGTGAVRGFLSEPNRQLANSSDYPTSAGMAQPYGIAAADLDRDGQLDVAVANNYSTSTIGILRGNPVSAFAIGFQPVMELPASTTSWDVAIGDVTGDGLLDLVVADGLDSTVSIFAGHGDATFEQRVTVAAGGADDDVALADLDGDGHLDIVTADSPAGVGIVLVKCP